MSTRDRVLRPPRSGYITPDGAKKMRDELVQLWHVERPRVTQEVADAAAQGDRSENAEYIYGKRRLRQIDSRVRFLTKRLEALTIVGGEAPKDPKRVFFGAWVTLVRTAPPSGGASREGSLALADDEGDEVTYRVVGPDEFDLAKGWISMDSPVARALMTRREGDEVVVKRPKGDIAYTIVGVRYEVVGPKS